MTYYYSAAGLNPQVEAPSVATPAVANADIVFPDVSDWAVYYNGILRCCQAQLGTVSNKLVDQGFFEIDQLTEDCISHNNLVQSLGIGIGIAALIIRYADKDIAKVQAGTLNMNPVWAAKYIYIQ